MPNDLYGPPPALFEKLKLKHLLAYLGPGAIVASVTIGNGELVWGARNGAVFGHAMLWCFFYAGVFKAFQVYAAARYLTLTGEHPLWAWRSLPGPPLWFPVLIAVPALLIMPIAFSGISEILATYIHRLAGMPLEGEPVGPYKHFEWWTNLWATSALVLTLGMALLSSYGVLEKASTVVLGMKVLFIAVAVVIAAPNLWDVLVGTVVPRTPVFEDWILTDPRYSAFRTRSPWLELSLYFTAVGGGAYDYIGYIAMLREKKWGRTAGPPVDRAELARAIDGAGPEAAEQRRRARIWLRAPLLDTMLSFAFVVLVTLLFAILGAELLHPRHEIPENAQLLSVQERFLTGIHPSLSWLYRISVFVALGGVLYGAYGVYRFTFTESFKVLMPKRVHEGNFAKWGRFVVAYCFLGGLTMVWLPASVAGNVVDRMTFGSIISGAASCGLWCLAMIWVDRKRLPPALRMGRGLTTAVAVAGLAMIALGAQSIAVYVGLSR